jgi:hypothetical protein
MNRDILQQLDKKTGVSDIVGLLADGLSGSELSSLLLAVYERKAGQLKPAELLAQYRGNRLVQPADVDMVAMLEAELSVLRYLRDRGFAPIALSPVAALGSCSVVASVSQDKVVSAVRNTEIVADATNVIALHAADQRRNGVLGEMRFCTVHRHLRTQPLTDKRHRPHFVIGCLVTAGRDVGSYGFECSGLVEHVGSLVDMLREIYGIERFRLVLKRRAGYPDVFFERAEAGLRAGIDGVEIVCEKPTENAYYRGVQFKLYVFVGGEEREIADGGFVDWTQRLLENKKERMLISGFGLELLYRFKML